MAIRIIKQGKKQKFTKICPDCGCEFEYEMEDVKTDYTMCLTSYPCRYKTYVVCPCCGKHIHHGYTEPDFSSIPSYPDIVWKTTGPSYYQPLDCDKCPSKPDPEKIVFGDTPCDWCQKNHWKLTSTSGTFTAGKGAVENKEEENDREYK